MDDVNRSGEGLAREVEDHLRRVDRAGEEVVSVAEYVTLEGACNYIMGKLYGSPSERELMEKIVPAADGTDPDRFFFREIRIRQGIERLRQMRQGVSN